MGMIIARRKAREFSLFKYFFKTLIKVCDPDEVWISSSYYYNNFWHTHDNPGDTLGDLLSGRCVVLVGDPRINRSVDIARLKSDLLRDLGMGTAVRAFIHNEPDSNLRSNDIQLYKDNRDIAGIVGSSQCTSRDLEYFRPGNMTTDFDIQTDMIYFDPSFDNDIITAMSSDDSELREVRPIGIDIFGIERRPEIDIMCNTNLKTFVTMSGLFQEI